MVDDDDRRPSGSRAGLNPGAVPTRPSTVKLPEQVSQGVKTIFDFFLRRFPRIPAAIWIDRFGAGKVWATGEKIDAETPYRPLLEVHYRREVECEPPVRDDYRMVWSDSHLLVVDKPPNLPVTPGGRWVQGCLLHLLLEATGNDRIAPLHRLDRLTSGVILLSTDPATRSHYTRLFQPHPMVEKSYTAVCELQRDPPSRPRTLEHHITRSPKEYWRQMVQPGNSPNARCEIEVEAMDGGLALVRVRPSTGRKHQIRVQLAHEGLPILGDPLYGTVRSNDPHDTSQRLWLDAHQLTISGFERPTKGAELNQTWSSSRRPEDFYKHALDRST